MRILVVEDEPLIRKSLLKQITQIDIEHFSLTELADASNADEASELLKKNDYDIVLTDIEMVADTNGLQLIHQWKEQKRETQWVIVSGYDRFDYAQQAIREGVQEYIVKPVTRKKISDVIVRCIQNKDDQNHDFIAPQDVDHYIHLFETAIWSIDKETLTSTLTNWRKLTEEKNVRCKYYCDLLTHMLEVLYRRISNKGSRLFQSFHWEIDAASKSSADTILSEKCFFLIEVIEQQRKGNAIDPIEVAKQYINNHLDEEVSLEEVAKKLGLNPSYFSQLFKKETGETFISYRIRLRMNLAKQLLLRKEVRVTDIPGLIGLNDHPHFTKTFKKFTGQTPSEYRMKMGMNE